ncbi:POL3 [Hepatospora eriocheir]|uniref:POL3 n=1 Tax=Hepatospora eriocheir TaxID=1081669 RepID=A0A1X0QHI4_9MICR|nr:POL3 [Hepatospora eriocheir]
MQQILNVLDFVKVYLDDILIHSENIDDHIQHYKIVLERLKNHNVKINFDKSKFIQYEVKYFGFIISNQGIKADIDKIDNIRNLHEPQNVKQLQKFLGFVNWFRDFLPDLSKILIPLTDKLKNNSKSFEWTKKDEIIRIKIFNLISKQVLLSHLDYTKKFELYSDVSDVGLSALLFQGNRLIATYSYKLLSAERNYTTVEKELLAIVKGIKHFKNMIWGYQITVYTDSKNLTYLDSPSNQRITHWKIALSKYDLTFIHVEESRNIAADYMSRFVNDNPSSHSLMIIESDMSKNLISIDDVIH